MITLGIKEFSMLSGIKESEIYHHILEGKKKNGVPFPKPLKQFKTHRFKYDDVMNFVRKQKGNGYQ